MVDGLHTRLEVVFVKSHHAPIYFAKACLRERRVYRSGSNGFPALFIV